MKIKGFQGPHYVTATAAATTDEGHLALDIVPGLGQTRLLALAQNIHRLVLRDAPGNPVPTEALGSIVEGEACLASVVFDSDATLSPWLLAGHSFFRAVKMGAYDAIVITSISQTLH